MGLLLVSRCADRQGVFQRQLERLESSRRTRGRFTVPVVVDTDRQLSRAGRAAARGRTGHLGELAASLVLCWSLERIIWGGGVMAIPRLLERLRLSLHQTLAGYGVGEAAIGS